MACIRTHGLPACLAGVSVAEHEEIKESRVRPPRAKNSLVVETDRGVGSEDGALRTTETFILPSCFGFCNVGHGKMFQASHSTRVFVLALMFRLCESRSGRARTRVGCPFRRQDGFSTKPFDGEV